jgi:hypothetical protein
MMLSHKVFFIPIETSMYRQLILEQLGDGSEIRLARVARIQLRR